MSEQLKEANRDKGKAELDLEKLQQAHAETLAELARLTREGDEAILPHPACVQADSSVCSQGRAELVEAQSTISRLRAELFEREEKANAEAAEAAALKSQAAPLVRLHPPVCVDCLCCCAGVR